MRLLLVRPPRRNVQDAGLGVPPLGLAYIAAAIALLATILSIVQLVTNDGTTASTMGLIVGITYIIHTIYAIYLGRGLLSRA